MSDPMEHEVFVPVPAGHLTAALADPDRVARALPGLQRDAAAEGVAGRLKLRVGGSSVTYRGSLGVTRQDDGAFTVEAEGAEARGDGEVRATVRVTLSPRPDGTLLRFRGTATATGRVTGFEPATVESALTRLLERFAGDLPGQAGEDTDDAAEGSGTVTDDGHGEVLPSAGEPLVPEFAPGADGDFDARPDADDASPAGDGAADAGAAAAGSDAADEGDAAAGSDAVDEGDAPAGSEAAGEGAAADEGDAAQAREADDGAGRPGGEGGAADAEGAAAPPRPSVFDAPVPPPSLDPEADLDDEDDEDDDVLFPEEPGAVADAAQARRTMIGRSAEEVDHAPPRGRYAPVPVPPAGVADRTLRWVAPAAAALAVAAGAIAVARVLRRHR